MEKVICPYCKEEVKAKAVLCKHCHSKLVVSRKQRLTDAIVEQMSSIASSPVSPCKASCYSKHDNVGLQQCFDNCRADEAEKALYDRLHQEFFDTVIDVIWAGVDIGKDPRKFEQEIRDRFSRMPDK